MANNAQREEKQKHKGLHINNSISQQFADNYMIK